MGEMHKDCAVAVIENGSITIRVPIDNLSAVVEGAWASGGLDTRFKVTDAPELAKELCRTLNDEDGEGTTPIHRLFDAAINEAMWRGAEGIEEHEDQEE